MRSTATDSYTRCINFVSLTSTITAQGTNYEIDATLMPCPEWGGVHAARQYALAADLFEANVLCLALLSLVNCNVLTDNHIKLYCVNQPYHGPAQRHS